MQLQTAFINIPCFIKEAINCLKENIFQKICHLSFHAIYLISNPYEQMFTCKQIQLQNILLNVNNIENRQISLYLNNIKPGDKRDYALSSICRVPILVRFIKIHAIFIPLPFVCISNSAYRFI